MLPINEKLKEVVQANCEFLISGVFRNHLDKHLSGITEVIHPALGQQPYQKSLNSMSSLPVFF